MILPCQLQISGGSFTYSFSPSVEHSLCSRPLQAWDIGDKTEMGLGGQAFLHRVDLLLGSLLSPTRTILVLCDMALQAWDWEEEERASPRPPSTASDYHSASECETEEYLKSRTPGNEWDSEDQFSSLHSSEGPACLSNSDVPQIVPCKFVISLAFPSLLGRW